MISSLLNVLRERAVLRYLSFSFLGTASGQAIVLLGTLLPIMAIYDPAPIGVFSIFLGISAIGSLVATGRFEMVVPVARDEHIAGALVSVAWACALTVSLLVAVVLLVWTPPWLASLGWAVWLLPAQIALGAASNTMRLWLSRQGRFDRIAGAEILRCSVMIGLQWGLAATFDFSAVGLVVGYVAGWAVYLAVALVGTWSPSGHGGWSASIAAARAYAHNLYLLVGQSMNACAAYAPIFFFRAAFDEAEAGLFYITLTFLYKPVLLLGQSVQQVFFPVASRQINEQGTCRPFFNRTVGWLLLVGTLVFVPMGVLAPWFLEWISVVVDEDPDKWAGAGAMIMVLAPFCIVKLASSAVRDLWIVAGRQSWDIVWQAGFLLAVLLGLGAGLLQESPMASVLGYAIATTIPFLINLCFCGLFASGAGHRSDRIEPVANHAT